LNSRVKVRRSIAQISSAWLSVYSLSGKPDLPRGPVNGVHYSLSKQRRF